MSDNQEKLNEQLFNVVANSKGSDEARFKKIKNLVRLGADVNTRLYGKSVLSKAIEKEAGAEVQDFLREKGADEWVISKEEALEVSQGFWSYDGYLKSLEEIKELLKKGADVEAKDKDGRTALMWAAISRKLDVVKCLVEHGADLEAKDEDGYTALVREAKYGNLGAVKCLVEQGADLEAKDDDYRYRRTALIWAAEEERIEVVKYLAEHGAYVNAKDEDGWTALMWAARLGTLDVVKCLAEHGADVNTSDKYGQTALDKAKYFEKDDCVEFLEEVLEVSQGFWDEYGKIKSVEEITELLKKGADANAKSKNSMTALMTAVIWGKLDVVKCLAEHGADLEVKDGYGQTALMKAAMCGYLDKVKYLVEQGADLEAKDEDGQTALMEAARCRKLDVVKYLAENGADVHQKNKEGKTVLDIARKWKIKDDCVKFLEEAQNKVSSQKTKGDKTGVSQIVKKNEGR